VRANVKKLAGSLAMVYFWEWLCAVEVCLWPASLALCMVMGRLKVMMGCGVVSGSRGVMMLDGRVLR
jgi:hypothetical protein